MIGDMNAETRDVVTKRSGTGNGRMGAADLKYEEMRDVANMIERSRGAATHHKRKAGR